MKIKKNELKTKLNIRTEKDFPIKGIEFIDITPLLLQKDVLKEIIKRFVEELKDKKIDYIVAPEARGFLFGSAVANELDIGFIPIRKKGKLPPTTVEMQFEYEKEYGKDILELPKLVNDEYKNNRFYILDDIYATGNTVDAIKNAIESLGGMVEGIGVVMNIDELNNNNELFSLLDVNEDKVMENTIVIASNNEHKIKEFKEILTDYNILTLNDIGYNNEIEETGQTFEENALIKAEAIYNYLISKNLNYFVVAEDSGLCVESLKGEPGVYSARYAGNHGDNEANRNKLLENLEGKKRDAYFICTIALIYPNGEHKIFQGKTFGRITEEEHGNKEFGYDCIFYSNDLNKTFGEASDEEKNSVSHRGQAIKEMLKNI